MFSRKCSEEDALFAQIKTMSKLAIQNASENEKRLGMAHYQIRQKAMLKGKNGLRLISIKCDLQKNVIAELTIDEVKL